MAKLVGCGKIFIINRSKGALDWDVKTGQTTDYRIGLALVAGCDDGRIGSTAPRPLLTFYE